MQRRDILTLFLVGLVLALAACTPDDPLTPITVQLKYFHQAQFAGFYAADQNGYYADEGLAVTFLEGGPRVDLEQAVMDGSAQFGVTAAEVLISERAAGQPLSAISVIYQRNPLVFMVMADSGIVHPRDIVGRRVQYNLTTRTILNAMLANLDIPPNQFEEVDVGFDLEQFYAGNVDVWIAFLTNEVLAARAAGYDVNVINPDDYGIHFYSDTIFTRDDIIADDPELVQRFLRATLKGWTFAVENPDQIPAMVVEYNPDADLQHESDQMYASLPLISTGEEPIGWMDSTVWADMETTLREQGVLTVSLDVDQVYAAQFVTEIYK
jgi:NitT/TauT family transport system substrate-binding protein